MHWDPFLHAWIVTRYEDVVTVLRRFSADRTPTPEYFAALGVPQVGPIAKLMVKQMLFLDAPAHTRLRRLAGSAFQPVQVGKLRAHIQDIADRLIDDIVRAARSMDMLADFAEPLPAMVTTELLGVPIEDHVKLKDWSVTFAEMLGNFQHNPDRSPGARGRREPDRLLPRRHREQRAPARRPDQRAAARRDRRRPPDRRGDRGQLIVTMVGGQETTTNLIGNGMLTLLRNPQQLERLRDDPSIIPSAVEELLRYEARASTPRASPPTTSSSAASRSRRARR